MSAPHRPVAGRDRDPSHRRSTALLPPGTLIGLMVAGFAALLIAFVSAQSSESRTLTARQLTQALEVIEQAQAVLSTLKDSETGQRGYLLSGDESYLEPYAAARTRYASELQQLRALVA